MAEKEKKQKARAPRQTFGDAGARKRDAETLPRAPEALQESAPERPQMEENPEEMRQTLLPGTAPETVPAGEILAERQQKAIGQKEIAQAQATLQEYKRGKANLERRIIENEQWYKMRHWDQIRENAGTDPYPASAWLFNSIANKHADAMDNYPEPNVLPREEGDKQEAKILSSILPVILERCRFEKVYSDAWWYKLKTGTGVYGVFWNAKKHGGLGDVDIRKLDLLNLFWEPGISDIQQSRNLFSVELADNDLLSEQYPQLQNLGGSALDISKYIYDDTVDTSKKTAEIGKFCTTASLRAEKCFMHRKTIQTIWSADSMITGNTPLCSTFYFWKRERRPASGTSIR